MQLDSRLLTNEVKNRLAVTASKGKPRCAGSTLILSGRTGLHLAAATAMSIVGGMLGFYYTHDQSISFKGAGIMCYTLTSLLGGSPGRSITEKYKCSLGKYSKQH